MKLKNIPNIEVGQDWFKFKSDKKLKERTPIDEVMITIYRNPCVSYNIEISMPDCLDLHERLKCKDISDVLDEYFMKKITCNQNDIIDILTRRE